RDTSFFKPGASQKPGVRVMFKVTNRILFRQVCSQYIWLSDLYVAYHRSVLSCIRNSYGIITRGKVVIDGGVCCGVIVISSIGDNGGIRFRSSRYGQLNGSRFFSWTQDMSWKY